ncbi:PAS domain S-box protein [Candidatus Woesearchaeota archaeon]|nr:PAS domain S-box protein [Candidatus Woesearchaeota archaeon]
MNGKSSHQIKSSPHELEDKFLRIFECAPDGIIIVNLKGKVELCNQAFIDLTGYSKKDIVGRHFSKLPTIIRRDILNYVRLFKSLIKGKIKKPFEFKWRRKDGAIRFGEIRINLIKKDKKVIGVQAFLRDITERKKTEEELFSSKENYKLLTEGLQDVIFRVSTKGVLEYISPAIKEFGGYTPEKEVGNFIAKYFATKKEFLYALQLIKKITIDKKKASIQFLYKSKKGEPFYVEVTAKPVIKGGKVITLQCVMRDISEHKKSEEMLKESEERYRTLFHTAGEVVIQSDLTGKIIDVNKAVEEYGLQRDELIGKTLFYFLTRESWPQAKRDFLEQLRGKSTEGETQVRTPGGVKTAYYKDSPIIKNGKVVGVLTIIRDITERKKIELNLMESEKRFRDISNSMADWIWEVDKSGKYTFASGKVKQILGYASEELIGKKPFDFMPKSEAQRVKEIFTRIAKEKGPLIDIENWNLTKNGKRVCLLTNGFPIIDDKGSLVGYRGVDKDITERKMAEEALKKKHRDLMEKEKEIISVNRQLEKLNEELMRQDTLKDTFLSNISHELRTPLTSIRTYNQLIYDQVFGPINKKQKESLKITLESADYLTELISNLLEISRFEVGKMKMHFSRENIIAVVNEVIKEFQPRVEEINGNILVHKKRSYMLNIDKTRIKQVYRNVIENSIKYRSKRPLRIEIRHSKIKNFVKIQIRDNGIGISKRNIKHLFNKFYQAEQAMTEKRGGVGLGLSIIKHIIEAHKGTIMIDSKLGKGTTVTICLPIKQNRQ